MSTGGGGLRGSDDDDEDGKDEAGMFDNIMDSPLYRSDDGSRDSEFGIELGNKAGGKKPDAYTTFLATYAPGEMVGQFMATAPPRVQTAVKQTVLGLLGSLRTSAAYDSNIVTTKNALASLMFQLELTGYMFRNAEYRLGLSQSLSKGMLGPAEDESSLPQVSGEIQVKLGDQEIKIDAESYVSELRREVENLRNELVSMKQQQAGQEAQDLLAYVQKLEEEEMKSLTEGVSPEVLGTMRSLVNTVVQGMGGELSALIGPDTLTEIPSSVLAQLCMWQLVVGYNLRTIEAREEMRKQLGPE